MGSARGLRLARWPPRSTAGGHYWLACLPLLTGGSALAADDPFVGAWELQPARSSYDSGAVPQAMIVTIETLGSGIHYRSISVTSSGLRARADYTAEYDGRPVLVTGNAGLLAPVALRRIASDTVEATYARGFHILAVSRWTVTADGRQLTIATHTTDAPGQTHLNVAVYFRAGESPSR